MKTQFTNTFIKSLKKLYWKNTLPYKTYSLFRYDLPRFFKNVWRFRKALYNHYWFDHHGTLMFLETGLTNMADTIEKYGIEIDSSRLKKVEKMRRAVQLIKNYNEDLYIEMAEAELGEIKFRGFKFTPLEDNKDLFEWVDDLVDEEKDHNNKVYARATEISGQEWKELWTILDGQDYSKFDKDKDFDDQFDGSGLRGWWD